MTRPRVTVFTAVYNGEPFLREAIESTLRQSYSDFEYLIIDDCSSDGSVECVQSFHDPRIRFVRNERNLGTARTINKAFSLITTPYVVRLDQDDVSQPNRVEAQVAYLDAHPEVSVVCSWEHTIDANGVRLRDWKRSIDNYGEFLAPILLGLSPIWHPSLAVRKEAMDAIGGFDPEYTRAEDFEVTVRLALHRFRAAVVPGFHLLQRQHASQQSSQFGDRMEAMAQRVHQETLRRFCTSPYVENLAYFLRLESDPTPVRRRRDYLLIIRRCLAELVANVAVQQRLSRAELESLERIIYRRIGAGIRYAPVLAHLPAFAFYATSPMHIPNARRRLSRAYARFLAFRYLHRKY